MRLITIVLAVLLLLIQYPLWMGKGGFFRARELSLQLEAAQEKNEDYRLRNAKLASEVRDLEVGTEAIEERARFELGMIKRDEIFIQVIDTSKFPGKGKPVEGDLALPIAKPEAAPTDTKPATQEADKPAAAQSQPSGQTTTSKPSAQAAPAQKPAANSSAGTANKPTANTKPK
ncbi:MAG: cell division protein FtsB [Oxalobacter sp.]|nr:cell division protein FtsB [Oxalobacter sp.]